MIERDMVWVPAGKFHMGSDIHYPEEGPAQLVAVDGFWMDRAPVTNRRFGDFVSETCYVTIAEQAPRPEVYPGVRTELLCAGSAVFVAPVGPVDLAAPSWWHYRPGACWSRPEGTGSSIEDRLDHPVVHVAYADAQAYARWCHKCLPTEAEWEYAARGSLDGAAYAWGDEARPDGAVPANIWEGSFPSAGTGTAHGTTTPGRFPANGYDLFDMIGNVWEWTQDWFNPGHGAGGCCGTDNQPEPTKDPLAVGGALRVLKGGSFLCADNYCARYRPAARIPQAEDSSAGNVGFRCIRHPVAPPGRLRDK